jgi:hypothetical protein
MESLVGINASIDIISSDSLEGLALKISDKLLLPKFWFKNDVTYPHSRIAICECLGFEIWLKATDRGRFQMDIESTVVSVEAQSNLVCVSEWFSRIIETFCDVKCTAASL